MTLLDSIRESAIRSDTPIGEMLRQLLVLAYRIEAAELKTWLTHEMDGYSEGSALPSYRASVEVQCIGEFALMFNGLPAGQSTYPVPKTYFPEEIHFLFRCEFRQPVAQYDDFLR